MRRWLWWTVGETELCYTRLYPDACSYWCRPSVINLFAPVAKGWANVTGELSLANTLGWMHCLSTAVVVCNAIVWAAGLATLRASTRLSKHPTVHVFSPSCRWKVWVWSTTRISSVLIVKGTTRFGSVGGPLSHKGLSFVTCSSKAQPATTCTCFWGFQKKSEP